MPGRSFAALAAERLAAGDPPDLPCCIISHAAQPDQHIEWSTLDALAEVEPGPAPVLLLTGWALAAAMQRSADRIAIEGDPVSQADMDSVPARDF
jgi:siroheme synthase